MKEEFKSEMTIQRKEIKITGHPVVPLYPDIWAQAHDEMVTIKKWGFRPKQVIDYTYIEVYTTLRKEYNGKWYLCHFRKSYKVKGFDRKDSEHTAEVNEMIYKLKDMIHKEVYAFIICGVVNENIVDSFGNKMFKVDTTQMDESRRLEKLLNGQL